MKKAKTKYRIVQKIYYYYDEYSTMYYVIKDTKFVVEKRLHLFGVALPLWKVFKYHSEAYDNELCEASFETELEAVNFIKHRLEVERKIEMVSTIIKEV